jgi:TPR repeat protein
MRIQINPDFMGDAKTNCPKCGGHVAYPLEMAGTDGSCPHCGENFLLPKRKGNLAWIAVIVVIATVACVAGVGFMYHVKRGRSVSAVSPHLSPLELQQKKAADGDSDSMFQLGLTYLNGNGVPTNTDEGMQWIQKAATAGNPKAMTTIGDSLLDTAMRTFQDAHAKDALDPNTGLPTNYITASNIPEECFNWYRKAAELGETNAMWQLIRNLNLGDSISSAVVSLDPNTGLPMSLPNKEMIRWLRKLTEAGDTDAMIQLGSIYIHGYNVDTNIDEGIKLFEKAGACGNLSAYSTLAHLYETGDGVTKDYYQAISLYEKAANKDDTSAELDLAKLYRDNEAVKDLEQSFQWYLKVAQKTSNTNYGMLGMPGNFEIEDALIPVAKAYDKGSGVAENKDEAIKWFTKAAEAGKSEAQWRLGVKYDLGDGVLKDKQKALQWYLKAANHTDFLASLLPGVAESQRNIGYLYQAGDGVQKDTQEAFKWFMKAANNGSEAAQFEIAEAYSSGIGVLQDKQEAFKWYQKSANGGSKSAQIKLALFYLGQVNSPANSTEYRIAAYEWLNLAAAQGFEDATQLRSGLIRKMSAKEVAEAQSLAKDFSNGKSLITNSVPILGASAFDAPITSAPDIADTPAFEVLNVTAKPTEQNDMWWRYGYRLTVRNNGLNTEGQWFHIQFLDAQGYVIDTTTTDSTVIRPGATEIITGEKLLQLPGAARVAKLKATWSP